MIWCVQRAQQWSTVATENSGHPHIAAAASLVQPVATGTKLYWYLGTCLCRWASAGRRAWLDKTLVTNSRNSPVHR